MSLLGCNIVKCCVLREKTWGLSKPPVCLEQGMRIGSAELFHLLAGLLWDFSFAAGVSTTRYLLQKSFREVGRSVFTA